MSGFLVAVDYGTLNTVAALRRPDGQVRPLVVDGSPLVPSAACAGPDGQLLVGRDAEIAGRVDPAGFVPDPGTRIDAGTVALGDSVFPVVEVIGGTLARVAREAIRGAGGALPRLVLTHPASWDENRLATLTEAGFRTGLGVPTLVSAPVAAGWYQTGSVRDIGPGRCLLVYHLGAGTFEGSLLRRTAEGWELLATGGLEDVGGFDLDGLLMSVVGEAIPPDETEAWQRLITPSDTTGELRRFMQLCEDVRAAKETLSRQLTAGLHIPVIDRDVHVGREDFESAAEPVLTRTVDVAADLLATTGTAEDQLGGILLLGGSSRIPLVATLLHHRFAIRPAAGTQPELAVAEGALAAVGQAAAAPPAVDPTPPAPPPAATAPRGRSTRLLAMAAALALVAVLGGWYLTRPQHHAVTGEGSTSADVPATARPTAPGAGVPAPGRAAGGPGRGPSPSTTASSAPPASTPPTSPSATALPPVAVGVSVTPTSGACSTEFQFAAHFTINSGGRYRWHWVFGGPDNYLATSGDHDQDKTGDVRVNKKFDPKVPGTYWAQVQITSPVTAASDPASVQVTC